MKNALSVDGIRETIKSIAAAERITKVQLGQLSRDMLKFINIQGHDRIDLVNELTVVLTPVNKRTAILFFKHHLPWSFDDATKTFMKKFDAGKKTDRKLADTQKLLDDVNANIWTWAESNVKVEFTAPNFNKAIIDVLTKAQAGKINPETGEAVGALSVYEIMQAVLQSGIEADAMLDTIGAIEAANVAAIEEATENTKPAPVKASTFTMPST